LIPRTGPYQDDMNHRWMNNEPDWLYERMPGEDVWTDTEDDILCDDGLWHSTQPKQKRKVKLKKTKGKEKIYGSHW
jgi:hypothetical protein